MPRGGRSSKLVGFLFGAGAFALVILGTQLLPGSGGERGTPAAILFQGLVLGLISSLIAAGLVLIYRTTRIINFAQASLGAAGGAFTYNLAIADTTEWPFFPAFLVGIVASGLAGVIVELFFIRRFFRAPRLVLTVITIALVIGLGAASNFVSGLPIFGDVQDRDPVEVFGGSATPPLPFDDFGFEVGSLGLPFGFPHLMAIGVSILSLLGLAYFLYRTKSGVAVRASSENVDRAQLLGINVGGLSTIVWGIAGLLSGIGIILTGAVSSFAAITPGQDIAQIGGPIILALSAAVIARMRSLVIAVAATVGLVMARQAFQYSFQEQLSLFDVGLFALILVGLLLQRKAFTRSEEGETTSWKASEEFRPTPQEIKAVGGIRIWRWVLIGAGIVAVLLYPWLTAAGATNEAGVVAIQAIALLSLIVLTGWAGQASLGQWALVAIGAVIGGFLTTKMDISFWLALPVGALATGLFSVLIGIPALRIKGLFLAVTTFALAFAVENNLFQEKYFGAILPGDVKRPTLFLLDFDDERSMYYLAVASLGLCLLLVATLRKSRPGRILIALRENENNIQSFGVNIVKTRLAAFALAGTLCGFAGVLFAHHQRAVSATSFAAGDSLFLFIVAVIGGIGSISGAMLGALWLVASDIASTNPIAALVIGPAGVLFVLYAFPGGFASIFFGLRDGVYRIIAQRRRIVVPSLFADIDTTAAEKQMGPLAEPLLGSGLSVLPFRQRYRIESRLYGRLRGLTADGRREKELATFDAAARRAEESEAAEEPSSPPSPPPASATEVPQPTGRD